MKRTLISIAAIITFSIIMISSGLIEQIWDGQKDRSNKGESEQIAHLEKNISTAAPIPASLSKEAIQEKMLNSIHYFDSAKGSFRYTSEAAGFDVTVDYKVKLKKNEVAYQIKETNHLQGESSYEHVYEEGQIYDIFHDSNEFLKTDTFKINDKGPIQKVKGSIKTVAGGQKEYYYPATSIQLGAAGTSLHSKEIALGFLENYQLWDVKGKEDFLGRKALLIEGTFSEYYQKKLSAYSYQLIMDEATGIVFQLEIRSTDGKVLDSLTTTDIKINETVSISTADVKKTYKEVKKN
ncbi:hypothetical protein LS684_08825 [Cytobacillus spongiae]|uniref:hypothetical protein n=1 Tax=Cytobacillus spongiae TaxID=2901381 RepID=UPI001F45FCCA|nr:hypothetical protein [Cytobacillus spongiae]UII57518.1 hypothetical protein LS684_08825 [Cytobacillus spongiae]